MKYKHTNTHAYFDLFNRLYILRSEYSLVSECMCVMRTDTPQQLSNGFNSTPSSSLSYLSFSLSLFSFPFYLRLSSASSFYLSLFPLKCLSLFHFLFHSLSALSLFVQSLSFLYVSIFPLFRTFASTLNSYYDFYFLVCFDLFLTLTNFPFFSFFIFF